MMAATAIATFSTASSIAQAGLNSSDAGRAACSGQLGGGQLSERQLQEACQNYLNQRDDVVAERANQERIQKINDEKNQKTIQMLAIIMTVITICVLIYRYRGKMKYQTKRPKRSRNS